MDKKIISYIITFLVLAGFVAVLFFVNGPSKPSETKVDTGSAALKRENAYFLGNKSAKVEIIEFSDFKCPACGIAAPEVKRAVESYGDKVVFYYRHFPLDIPGHEISPDAAKAAEAAGKQGKFWEMDELLFQNQASLNDDLFVKLAKDLNLNVDQFNADRNSEEIAKIVEKDKSDALSLGVNGTPTFFINGEQVNLSNIPQFEDWKQLIDNKLKQ